MALDLENEQIISFREAAERSPGRNGLGVHVSAIRRWARDGISGVKLDAAKIGGTFFTSIEALKRFSDALTDPASTPDADLAMVGN